MTEHLREFASWDLENSRAQSWRPAFLEEEMAAPWPARLPPELEGLFLSGIIDRIDLDSPGRRFRIVDYKTRISASARESKAVQLPFYSELASKKLGAPWRMESARLFLIEDAPDKNGLPREEILPKEEWDRNRAAFWDLAGRSLSSMASGVFPIRPQEGDFGHCARCEFSSLCRKNHRPSRRRADLAGTEDA